MASYAVQVEPQDRWAIAAYIRALQLSQNAKPTDLPADVRGKLETAPKSRCRFTGRAKFRSRSESLACSRVRLDGQSIAANRSCPIVLASRSRSESHSPARD